MKEREKLEMVKMCVDALLEGRKLEFSDPESRELEFSEDYRGWVKYEAKNIAIITDRIMRAGWQYRIAKPTIKVRYRLFKWHDDSTLCKDGIGHITSDETNEAKIKNMPYFRGWIGDWQEVEIEE